MKGFSSRSASIQCFVPCASGIHRVPAGSVCGVVAVALLLVYEQSLVRADDLSQVKRAFYLNGYVGILYLAATAASIYVH